MNDCPPRRREPPLLLLLGIVIGFALSMLADSIIHAVAYRPEFQVEVPPMYQMSRDTLVPGYALR